MKKIFLAFVLFFFLLDNSFAFKNLWEIRIFYTKKVVSIENKIFNKYENKLIACKYEKNFYKKLDNIIKKYIKKYPKYKTIFKIFLEVNNYREVQIKNKCDRIKLIELIKEYESKKNKYKINNNTNSHNISDDKKQTENTKTFNENNNSNISNKLNNSQNKNEENTNQNINKSNNDQNKPNKFENNNEKNRNQNINKPNKYQNKSNEIKNNNDQNNTEKSNIKTPIKTNNENVENKDSIKLNFKIDKIEYDYNENIKLSNFNKSIKLPTVWKIDKIYDKFTIQVNNHWVWFKKIKLLGIVWQSLNNWIDYAKKKYNPNFIFYRKVWNKYELYLIDKNDIIILDPFDPSKSVDYNINQLSKLWHLYIKDLKYKNIKEPDNIIIAWIFKYQDKLYYIALAWKWQYFYIKKNEFNKWFVPAKRFKKWSIIIDQNDKLIIWAKGMKIFYLWKYNMYKNIDLNKLWKILYMTFYIIWKYNFSYNVQDMYDLIKFTKQFDKKTLKQAYKWMITNFKYNEKINNILNENWMNQKILNNEVNADKTLIRNWNVFYSLKNKEWVCQSISDIFSLIALFNWQNASTVTWISKRWYLHQLSKINWKYYDPTFDLSTKSFEYFWMTKNEVEKYIDLKN